MAASKEDAIFAEHVLRRQYATEEQVQECLALVERLRSEMELDETLGNLLQKKGYLTGAQARAIEAIVDPGKTAQQKNALPGYQLVDRIGIGAMGAVYKAHHLKLDIPVAVKVLRLSLAASPTQIGRLKREAQVAAQLNHENIVRCLDVGESNDFHYLAMEFVDGTTVRERLRKGPLPEREALRIVRDVARALEHAHTHGVIHRDVKPGNIMLTREGGRVKLVDFGLARARAASDLTMDHVTLGTPQYISPEQAGAGSGAGYRSDLFSLGATLYHMVTGRPPFDGETIGAVYHNVLRCKFPPPEEFAPGLGVDTLYVIHKLMRPHPRDRYANAAAVIEDLEKIERGDRVAPADFKGDHAQYLRRRRTKLLLWGGAGAAALLAIGFFTAGKVREAAEEQERVERCSVANETGKDDLKTVSILAHLVDLQATLAAVSTEGCRPEEVVDLESRRARVGGDLGHLARAKALLEDAKAENAGFRTLYDQVKALRQQMHFVVGQTRLDEISTSIHKLSAEDLEQRQAAVYYPEKKYATAQDALAALRGFGKDLKGRYADPGATLVSQVAAQILAYEELDETWERTDEEFPTEDNRFAHIWVQLDRLWTERHRKLIACQRAKLTGAFLDLFRNVKDEQLRDLKERESTHFTSTVRKKAVESMQRGDLTQAEVVVRGYRDNAYYFAKQADELLKTIKQRKDTRFADQSAELKRLRARFVDALERRDYRAAYDLIDEPRQKTGWTAEYRRQIDDLWARARQFKSILDVLEARAPGKKPADLSRAELEAILKFDDDKLGDPKRRAHFLAGESYADPDPRARLRALKEAITRLKRLGDAWASELGDRAVDLEKRVRAREVKASEVFASLTAAQKRKDHGSALVHCRELLNAARDGLRLTDYADNYVEQLKALEADLLRRAGSDAVRIEAGLPPRNVHDDAESGRTTLTFDFQEWFPDEDAVPPGEGRRWLEERARKFWERHGKAYARATRQLLFFNEKLVADEQHAVLAGEERANYDAWLGRRAYPHIIEAKNPFDLAKGTSIDVEVSWDEKAAGYFALTAGRVQGALAYFPRPNTGLHGTGAALFVQESPDHELSLRFRELFVPGDSGKENKKVKRAPDLAYPSNLHLVGGGKDREWYRIRLEIAGGEARLYAAPVAEWSRKELVRLAAIDPSKDLMLDGNSRIFRIVSFARCHIRKIVMTGHLRQK